MAYLGHLLIENRHGLIADAMATVADGFAEREAATVMVVCHQWQRAPGRRRTVGADKGYSHGASVSPEDILGAAALVAALLPRKLVRIVGEHRIHVE